MGTALLKLGIYLPMVILFGLIIFIYTIYCAVLSILPISITLIKYRLTFFL